MINKRGQVWPVAMSATREMLGPSYRSDDRLSCWDILQLTG